MTIVARLRTLAVCALLLAAARPAAAQEQRAVLELLVNGVAKGEAVVVLKDTDALIGVARLREAGIAGFQGTRQMSGSEELVSLASLASAVTYSIDERDLRLVLTVSPSLLGESVRRFGSAAPREMIYRSDSSAFVNYAVNWTAASGASVFAESAGRMRNALVYNTVSMSEKGALRGLTSVTVDERRSLRRWVVGDGYARTGALGGDAWTGGITVTREFGIEPYFVRHPSLSLSTPVAVPSVVEVHVNGRIVSQEDVLPGRLDMRDLPLTVGRNDAKLVVRDAFGNSREISTSYYLASSVLAPGLHDYQYSLGFRRDSVGSASWDYKEPIAMARHRVGVNNSLTLGGRAEGATDLVSAGPSVNLRLPIGELEGAAGVSGGREGHGSAAMVGYSYGGRPLSLGASLVAATENYVTVNARTRAERASREGSVYGSVLVGPGITVMAQHSFARLYGGVSNARTALTTTLQINRITQFTASAARVSDENGRGREVFAGLSILVGGATVGTSVAQTRDRTSVAVEAQQPLPVGEGYGYQARMETGEPGSFSGAMRYQSKFGRYEVRRDDVGGNGVSSVNAAGSLVAIGGRLFASRPVQQSFALVRVPGVEGVRGFSSNQEIGRTNAKGDLLVPDLQPYYGNLLNIADSDIPLQYAVNGVRLTLAVPYRGGAMAVFPVQLIRRVTGSVRITDGTADRVPEYGEIRISPAGAPEAVVSPVGSTGEFYFENLPSGRHAAAVQDEKGSCTFSVDVPESGEPLVNLGALRCTATAGAK